MVERKVFGFYKNQEIPLFVLKNASGMEVGITSLGAIITSVKVAVNGVFRECTLGFDALDDYISEEYRSNYPYFGAIIGRNAGRVSYGELKIDNKAIQLSKNHSDHHLHGGFEGFDSKIWSVESVDHATNSVTFSYFSKDGEEGYPGNATILVTYSLSDSNELKVSYSAETDYDTVLNLTQHAYFNFNEDSGDILSHQIQINSEKFVPLNEDVLPTGAILNVENTNFDFRTFKPIPSELDNSFVLNHSENNVAGILVSPDKKLRMEVRTSYPVLHIYAGFYIPELDPKHRKRTGKNFGVCFEAQGFADAPNHSKFKSTILRKGELYSHFTTFKFLF